MAKEIKLTRGYATPVSDQDFDWLNNKSWYYSSLGYAVRKSPRLFGHTNIYMHREIIQPPAGFEVDHINGNKLDNRRENLRACTRAENECNKTKKSNNTSGYKGVSWDKKEEKWEANITVTYKSLFLGYFKSPKDAARAYDEAARKYHGNFAKTNF